MRVWNWDGVVDEIGYEDFDLPEDASTLQVVEADRYHFDPTGNLQGEYDRHIASEMPGLTVVTARWGRDAQYTLWWGEKAEAFTKLLKGEV